jgi:transcriptional regulator with XRE-family HTH domain
MEPANDPTPPIGPLSFGDRMREARQLCGLTQRQVATYTDISQSALSQIENDEHSPSIDCFKKLLLVYIANTPAISARPGPALVHLFSDQLLFGETGGPLVLLAHQRYGADMPVPEDIE